MIQPCIPHGKLFPGLALSTRKYITALCQSTLHSEYLLSLKYETLHHFTSTMKKESVTRETAPLTFRMAIGPGGKLLASTILPLERGLQEAWGGGGGGPRRVLRHSKGT